MKIEIRTVNSFRTTSLTGMHLKEWMYEAHIQVTIAVDEHEHEAKVAQIGNERMALEREMKRLMGLIK
jgi:hypothetical protein